MCGFAGIINSPTPLTRERLLRTAERVKFRGPDSMDARVFDEHLLPAASGIHGVFFNRLAIIDLDARSNQPFEDERYTLAFNGEIYNYRELRRRLESEGELFRTTSDTEVLFVALRHWGLTVLPELNGMFAFFWLDRMDGRFVLARDRVGIKPLYYAQEDASVLFGSELDSLARLSAREPAIDRNAVNHYLWFQYTPTPLTILEGYRKLPPGHVLEGHVSSLRAGQRPEPHAYWDVYAFLQEEAHPQDGGAALEETLLGSLRSQLVADVPLGLFLSSGVDSNLLAALANKHLAQDRSFRFFTVAYDEETPADESKEAAAVLAAYHNPRLEHVILRVSSDYLSDHLGSLYHYYDEPFGDPASLLNWVISKKAREHVTVVLSGDGGDELFWGYPRYAEWEAQINDPFNHSLPGRLLYHLLRLVPKSRPVRRLLQRLEPDPVRLHHLIFLQGDFPWLRDPLDDPLLWAMKGVTPLSRREDLPSILDLKMYLLDAMLYKVDRSSMASSLEVRVPYLDNAVLELALRLGLRQKSTERFPTKAPLKSLLGGLAPQYNLDSPKRGFAFPLHRWLQTRWKEMVLSMLTADRLAGVGLDPGRVLPILRRYYQEGRPRPTEVWYLLNLVLWHDAFRAKMGGEPRT